MEGFQISQYKSLDNYCGDRWSVWRHKPCTRRTEWLYFWKLPNHELYATILIYDENSKASQSRPCANVLDFVDYRTLNIKLAFAHHFRCQIIHDSTLVRDAVLWSLSLVKFSTWQPYKTLLTSLLLYSLQGPMCLHGQGLKKRTQRILKSMH